MKRESSLARKFLKQLAAVQGESSAVEFAEKTIEYAKAKMAYIMALREAEPELENIATGREARPPEVDRFAGAFSLAGEKQEHSADEETAFLLKRFSGNPDIEKARTEFERAQKVEEQFHKDFDGVDSNGNSLSTSCPERQGSSTWTVDERVAKYPPIEETHYPALRNFSILASSSGWGFAVPASHVLRVVPDVPTRDAIL
jgi:hypothetical protein